MRCVNGSTEKIFDDDTNCEAAVAWPKSAVGRSLLDKCENKFDSDIFTFAEEKKRANDMDKSADPEHSLAM